jgi:UDP-N-acetyl-D-mannosaminuronate dehydrogenase
VELCDWLIGQRANLAVFDPAITRMPERWRGKAEIYEKAEQVFAVCDALVVATPWPQFKDVNFSLSPKKDVELVVFDPGFHLNLAQRQHVDTYYAVGVSENLGQK